LRNKTKKNHRRVCNEAGIKLKETEKEKRIHHQRIEGKLAMVCIASPGTGLSDYIFIWSDVRSSDRL